MDKDYMNILRKSMDDCIEEAYNEGFNDGKSEISKVGEYSDKLWKKAYDRGLNDAWECAKKIVLNESDGGLSISDLRKAFNGAHFFTDIIITHSPSEAIAKIPILHKMWHSQSGV